MILLGDSSLSVTVKELIEQRTCCVGLPGRARYGWELHAVLVALG